MESARGWEHREGRRRVEIDRYQYDRYVESWLAARASPKTTSHLAELLVTAVDVVGAHGRGVLGDVMLEAICSRVLARAEGMHPCLAAFHGRMSFPTEARGALAATATAEELHAATRVVVAELLRVLSHLTGGVLTARLYEKLGTVGVAGSNERGGVT